MTSSIVEDGVMENYGFPRSTEEGSSMENSGEIDRSAEHSMENFEQEGALQGKEGGDGSVVISSPVDADMVKALLGEIDRLREKVRILEHADKANQSAVTVLSKAAERAREDGEVALIAYQYAIIKEREECARLVEALIIGREENGRTGVALADAARKIRNRKS